MNLLSRLHIYPVLVRGRRDDGGLTPQEADIPGMLAFGTSKLLYLQIPQGFWPPLVLLLAVNCSLRD
jgi:hypothetical protein